VLRIVCLLACALALAGCANSPSAPAAGATAPASQGSGLQLPSISVPNPFGERLTFQGNSMAPAIAAGANLTVQKASEYHRGDIVVVETPPDRRGVSVRRIVGLPGEKLEVRAGKVLIDGQALAEPYVAQNQSYEVAPVSLTAGQYYVLADNRNASGDSRAWGPVAGEWIHGIAQP
jgi:signal peptidase I